jgi:hypothetical protein
MLDLHVRAGIYGDYPVYRIRNKGRHLHEWLCLLLRPLLFAMQFAWRFLVYGREMLCANKRYKR